MEVGEGQGAPVIPPCGRRGRRSCEAASEKEAATEEMESGEEDKKDRQGSKAAPVFGSRMPDHHGARPSALVLRPQLTLNVVAFSLEENAKPGNWREARRTFLLRK